MIRRRIGAFCAYAVAGLLVVRGALALRHATAQTRDGSLCEQDEEGAG